MSKFKMQSPYKKDPVPVYEVPFDDPSLMGKANKNGSIIMNKDQARDPEMRDKILKHEKHHLKEMIIDKNPDGSPVLDYDSDSVTYKGVNYSRDEFDEGNKELPWEKEAYNENEDIDIIPNPDKLSPLNFKKMGEHDGHADQDEVNMNESFNPLTMKNKILKGHRGNTNPFKMMQDKGLLNENAQYSHLRGPSFHEPGHDEELTVRDIENQNKSIKNAYRNFTGQNATFSPSEVNFAGNKRQYRDTEGRSMIETTIEGNDEVDIQPFASLSAKERDQYSTSRSKLVDDAFWQSDAGKEYLSQTKGTGRRFNTRSGEIELTSDFEKPTEASEFFTDPTRD